jgi:hypothetical protein
MATSGDEIGKYPIGSYLLGVATLGIAAYAIHYQLKKSSANRQTGWEVDARCERAKVTSQAKVTEDIAKFSVDREWQIAQSEEEVRLRLIDYFESRFPQCGDAAQLLVEHPQFGELTLSEWASELWQYANQDASAGVSVLGEGVLG